MAGIQIVGPFVAAVILIAILLMGGLAVAGISVPSLRFPNFLGIGTANNNSSGANSGTLAILLTDAPVQLSHLNVTIDKVMVQETMAGNQSGWVTLAFVDNKSQVSVDLLTLGKKT